MNQNTPPGRRAHAPLLAAMLLPLLMLTGCNLPSTGSKVYQVEKQYDDLANRSVAVVVSTGDHIDFTFPEVREQLSREITHRLATNVPGIKVTDPEQILKFQKENPYWSARAPSEIIRALGVERVILIEVGEYRTHEAGNKHILRGVVTGNVNLLEAEAPNPDNYAFTSSVRSSFPEEQRSKIGFSNTTLSEETVETEARRRFATDAAGLFYDHKIKR